MQLSSLQIILVLVCMMLCGKISNSLLLLNRIASPKKSTIAPIVQRGFSTPVTPAVQKTGIFIHQLPEIYPSDVYFKKAIKKAREVKIDPTIKNLRNANRKHCAIVLDTLMKALTVPITNVLNIYKKQMKSLHPYEVLLLKWCFSQFLHLHRSIHTHS
jgi:hypothetical protein